MKRSLTALAATAALFAGCGGSEFAPNRPALQQAFERTIDYWDKQGLTISIGDTMLKTVVDSGVPCGDINVTNDSVSPAIYCNGIKTILIPDLTYGNKERTAVRNGISPEAMAAAVMGHEAAHTVFRRHYMTLAERQEERLADCLSGVTVKATSPELGTQAAAFLGSLGDREGEIHGTAQERTDAFNTGFNGGIAACDSELPIILSIG